MATTVFDLQAILGIDTSAYESGLKGAVNFGAKALTAATTAMVGMGAASVKTGAEFDSSMSQVAATMGTTVDEIGELRDFAQEMGRTTAFSATQAADALNYMALAGYDADKSMEMLPNVLNLAAAGSMDLARASDMVTDTQTAFGISLKRTSQMVDEMAKAASTGNTSVEQLGDAFLTVGGLAQELNGGVVTLKDGTEVAVDGVQELEIALTAMANAGIKGSEAGTHMRNMLMKLSSPSSDGTKALEAMGVAVFDAEGHMRSLSDIFGDLNDQMSTMTQEQRIQTITDLFNARDIASAEAMLNAVSQDWDKIGASIIDAEGAASQMAETQLDNLAGDVTLFKSALEGAEIAISDTLTPSLRDFVKFGTDGLSRLTEAFQNGGLTSAMEVFGELLSEGLNMIIQKLPTFVEGGVKLLEAFGQGIADNLPVIIDTASQILTTILNALIDNLDTIVPLITQFIVGFVQIMADNADKMVEIAIAIAGAIGDGLIQAAPIIAEAAPKVIEAFSTAIAENPQALIALGPSIIGFITKGIKIARPLISGIGKLLSSGLGTSIMSGLSSIGSAISGFFSSMISGIGTFLTSTVGTVLTSVVAAIVAFFAGAEIGKTIGHAIFPDDAELYEGYQGIMGTLQMIKDFFIAVKDFIVFGVEDSVEYFKQCFETIKLGLGLIAEWFISKFEEAKNNVMALWNGIVEYFQNLWNGIVAIFTIVDTWFKEKFEEAKTNVTTAWDTMTKFFSDIWDGIVKVFEIVGTWFQEKFQEAKDNILNVWSDIKDKFSEIWENIKSAFNIGDALQWGKDMIDNFINGIKQKWEDLKTTVKQTAESIKQYLGFSEPEEGPLSNFHTYAPDMMDLFAQGIRDNEKMLTDTVADAFDFQDVIANADGTLSVSAIANGSGNLNNNDITEMIANALSNILVEVNIGDEKLDNIISTSIQRTNYRSGGR